MESQNEDDEFDINICSDDESIIDIMLYDKKDIRVRIKTMTVIENLPVINADIPECLLPRLPIRDSSVVSSLTSLSGKVLVVRSRVEEIKQLLTRLKSF